MSARTALVLELAKWVGPSLSIEELGNGWPSLAVLTIDEESVPLSLFVSTVTRSHRGRDAVERRFQNPDNVPLVHVPGRHSVLAGIWNADDLVKVERPVVALAEANKRGDGRQTRWSVFLPYSALKEAEESGWSADVTGSGETLRFFSPAMFPLAVTAAMNETEPDEKMVLRSISSLGLLDETRDNDRVRRTVTSLVRDSRFSGAVLDAYGRRCAMCGLSLGLVQGAHIHPASAPGSKDNVSNGLALCANHHLAFDRYLVAVRPDTMEIIFNPSLLLRVDDDPAALKFVENTAHELREAVVGSGPDPEAFELRYMHYRDQYSWIDLYR